MRIRFLKRGKWKKLDRTDKILLILYTIVVVLIICMVWNYVGSWSIGENLSEFRAKRKGIILILVLPISFLFAIILKIREIRREKKKTKKSIYCYRSDRASSVAGISVVHRILLLFFADGFSGIPAVE